MLDTETTGLEPEAGHRIIEIGAVEMVNRRLTGRHFHQYLNPQRDIDQGALEVHGITLDFLADKPCFTDVAGEFLEFIAGAELIIHNAPFDVAFLNAEIIRSDLEGDIGERCSVLDSLALARQMHPGQRNSLDALCKRYAVDNSQRDLHGALLDAEILADVFLAMTGGQTSLALLDDDENDYTAPSADERRLRPLGQLRVVRADMAEWEAHRTRLRAIHKAAGSCLWLELVPDECA